MTVTEPSTDEQRSDIRLYDVAAVFFFSIVTGAIGYSVGRGVGGADSYAEKIGSLVGLWFGLIPGGLLVTKARGIRSFRTEVRLRFRLPVDLLGVPIGIVCSFLLSFGYWVVAHWVDGLQDDASKPAQELTKGIHGVGFWLFAVLLVVGAPLVEEIYYRGMVLQSLKRYVSPTWAIVISGFIFGGAHFELITLVGLSAFGIVLAYVCDRTNRLGMNFFIHAGFNLVAVIGLWLA